jgi:sugar lactone lactonase YvrE
MSHTEPTVLLDHLLFPEGPRWHDGRLFFSDMHDRRVVAVDPAGRAETVVAVPQKPSGLGWLPDGRLLVVSMEDRHLMVFDGNRLAPVADLSKLATFHCNDMVVDRSGRAFVGNFGSDLHGGAPPKKACLISVEPDGTARLAAEDLAFPNGMVITPDGRTLIVAESMAQRLTAFELAADGSLRSRRVFADLEKAIPDGICLDAEGCVWIASPFGRRCIRVREGGAVVDEIPLAERDAFACMLGGDDRRTLFICAANTSDPEKATAERAGRIEMVRVSVPGAGLP